MTETESQTGELDAYLSLPDTARIETPLEARAQLLDASLRHFTSLDLHERERMLPTLAKFIMDEPRDDQGSVRPTITEEVLTHLADDAESAKLRQQADQISHVKFY